MLQIVIGLVAYALLYAGAQFLIPGGKLNLGQECATISDDELAKIKIKEKEKNGGGGTNASGTSSGSKTNSSSSTSKNNSSSTSDNKKSTDLSGFFKIGGALSLMHAEHYGSLSKVINAVKKKYYGIECDLQGYNGKLYCYHTNKGKNSPTLAATVKEANKSKSSILIDIKDSSAGTLKKLANFIKDNKLQKRMMIAFQLNEKPEESMKIMNSTAGMTLQYWGLIVGGKNDANTFASKAQTLKKLGMTTIHLPKYGDHGYKIATKENVNKLKNAGYKISFYTWSTFSSKEITKHIKLGASYLMAHDIDAQKSK